MPELRYVRTEQLVDPETPIRSSMDDEKFAELCDSIRKNGVLQNLVVVRVKKEHPSTYPNTPEGSKQAAEDARVLYRVMAGHRRLLAARSVSVAEVPCLVYEDEHAAEEAILLAENACREDVNPLDEAVWFAELLQKHDWTEQQLCNAVQRKPDYIYDRMKLLEYDEPAQTAIRAGTLSLATAREIHRCKDTAHRAYLLDIALRTGLTAAAARSMVRQFEQQPVQGPMPTGNGDSTFTYVEPSESPLKCEVCGGDKDPQNLAWIAVHKWELEGFRRLTRATQLAGEKI